MHVKGSGVSALAGVTAAFVLAAVPTGGSAECSSRGMQVQILGSGGPGASGGRASAGYLVWIDGVGRIMVDAGSGTKDQFHRTGASVEDVELFAISHFHPDHSSELPAILWPSGTQSLVAGPAGGAGFPSVTEFIDRLFGEAGVFPVLAARMQGLEVMTVDTASRDTIDVWDQDGVRVHGIGVPHATVPTVGYRIQYDGASVVFSSDQNGSEPAFIDFIEGADVLVIHMTVNQDATGFGAQLHAKPSVWGQLAEAGDVGRVLVSHIAAPTMQALQPSLDVLSRNYSVPVTVGEDLMCVDVSSRN